MKILVSHEDFDRPQLVLLFGLGLIGSAIEAALLRQGFKILADVPMDWKSTHGPTDAQNRIERVCVNSAGNPISLAMVWSAGKTGFFSPEKATEHEYNLFENVFRFYLDLKENLRPSFARLHHFSSAGGLFEGQRVVRLASTPSPRRPYGILKYRQEQLLLNSLGENEAVLYRPSSVYGPTHQDNRQGLINTLINNARSGCASVLDAHVMSLRDYVFAGDIGQYVARQIRFEFRSERNSAVDFLVSTKCSSIFEVVEKIRRILNLQVRFRYDDQFGNHENITFSDSVLPPGWRPVTLEMGIRNFLPGRHEVLTPQAAKTWHTRAEAG
jgi:UDP-glucose 4-epimerase